MLFPQLRIIVEWQTYLSGEKTLHFTSWNLGGTSRVLASTFGYVVCIHYQNYWFIRSHFFLSLLIFHFLISAMLLRHIWYILENVKLFSYLDCTRPPCSFLCITDVLSRSRQHAGLFPSGFWVALPHTQESLQWDNRGPEVRDCLSCHPATVEYLHCPGHTCRRKQNCIIYSTDTTTLRSLRACMPCQITILLMCIFYIPIVPLYMQ